MTEQAPARGSPAKKYQNLEQIYTRILTAFTEKYPTNEKLQKAVKGKTRKIYIHVTDAPSAAYVLENETLHRVDPQGLGKADIKIEANAHDLLALFNKELPPVQAYFTKKVRIQASMSDLLLAKSFLG